MIIWTFRRGAAACLGSFSLSVFAAAPEVPGPVLMTSGSGGMVTCNFVRPDYPRLSREGREQGTVKFRFEISVTGEIENVSVLDSTGYPRLDESARKALIATRCSPYRDAEGNPVRAASIIPITFGGMSDGMSEADMRAEKLLESDFKMISVFSLGMIGFAGRIGEQEKFFRKEQAKPDAQYFFKRIMLSQDATIESRMYAMCGLRNINLDEFDFYKSKVKASEKVSVMNGDVLAKENASDVLHRIEKFGCDEHGSSL